MWRAPARARRPPPRRRRALATVAILCVIAILGVVAYGANRVYSFLGSVANVGNPFQVIRDQVAPPPGSVAYMLDHGQQVNILVLGYGGSENDAPLLTDTIMGVELDPTTHQAALISVPRDLWVSISADENGSPYQEKVNAAFEIPQMPAAFPGTLKPAYRGRYGGGRLAEATVGALTGIHFDYYAGVDFEAFRDAVNALGGITVHMTSPLDDCHYPNYGHGYLNHGVPPGEPCPPGSGIHFPAGTYQVNGEQALELARSRHASEPAQASDFARAQRQQMIIEAIKQKAMSVGGLAKLPALMSALQGQFQTDMSLTDIRAVYDFMAKVPNSSIRHFSISDQNLVDDYGPGTPGSCGPSDQFVLCPEDPTYQTWHQIFSRLFVPSSTLAEHVPLEVVNASDNATGLEGRVGDVLSQLGFDVASEVRGQPAPTSVVYDYSGGHAAATDAWLASFIGARIVNEPPSSTQHGLVVVLGHDFALRWYGLA
jgi:LCP family protein required for cell wall assembly